MTLRSTERLIWCCHIRTFSFVGEKRMDKVYKYSITCSRMLGDILAYSSRSTRPSTAASWHRSSSEQSSQDLARQCCHQVSSTTAPSQLPILSKMIYVGLRGCICLRSSWYLKNPSLAVLNWGSFAFIQILYSIISWIAYSTSCWKATVDWSLASCH